MCLDGWHHLGYCYYGRLDGGCPRHSPRGTEWLPGRYERLRKLARYGHYSRRRSLQRWFLRISIVIDIISEGCIEEMGVVVVIHILNLGRGVCMLFAELGAFRLKESGNLFIIGIIERVKLQLSWGFMLAP